MSKVEFAENNFDILFPIESSIAFFYRKDLINNDYDVIRVLEALYAYYRAITTNFPLPEPKLSQNELDLYTTISKQCDGKDPKALLECVKVLKKSALLWNKNHGSQGYLQYISRFV
jgi:hypothetical protein